MDREGREREGGGHKGEMEMEETRGRARRREGKKMICKENHMKFKVLNNSCFKNKIWSSSSNYTTNFLVSFSGSQKAYLAN